MCGLAGFYCADGLGKYRAAFQNANNIIEHRGPDGQGIAMFNTQVPGKCFISLEGNMPDESVMDSMTLGLGHRRLAIIDLSASGMQPMANEDETVWIILNGEIYNYLELRAELEKAGHRFHSHSDTETILHAYEEWGEGCVNRFNGMWSFALLDLKRQRLFCSRDRFGIKPFYYYFDGKHFVWGSEIKQILCFPFVPRKVNERAAYEFLAYTALDYCEETFFDGIFQLLQGHNLTLDLTNMGLSVNHYYQPALAIDSSITSTEAAQEFRRLLTDAVRLHLRSDVEVGSCLSGGLDSSSLVCLMHQQLEEEGKGDIQRTFSSHFQEKEANELKYMQMVIQSTGINAHFTYPTVDELLQDIEHLAWHQDEPFGSTSIFAQWSVFKLVHQNKVKVMLDGQGADELMAGYITLTNYYLKELYSNRNYLTLAWETLRYAQFHPETISNVLPFARVAGLLRKLKSREAAPPVDWIHPRLEGRYREASRYVQHQQLQPFGEAESLNNTLYQLTFHTNLPALLHFEDRDSMAFSVESRVPFLDYRLVEFIFSLPSALKIRNGYTKRVLRDGMAGIIPDKIRWRTGKLGFATPEQTWQKQALRPLVQEALNNEWLHSFVLPDKARSYQEAIEKIGVANSVPWRWVSLYLWMKVFQL